MNRKRVRGFTIVELLVVITIIGMLMAMLMPAVGKVRSQVRRVQCIKNQSEIAKAVVSAASSDGNMPRALERWPGTAQDPTNQKWHGWVVPMLRQLGKGDVYDQILDGGNANSRNVRVYLEELVCPSDKPPTLDGAPLSYVVNGGGWDVYGVVSPTDPADWKGNGSWSNNVCLATQPPVEISMSYIAQNDGTKNTLMLGENVNAEEWNQPTIKEEHMTMLWHFSGNSTVGFTEQLDQQLVPARARPSSYHDGSFVVAFCDAHVVPMSNKIAFDVYSRLMSSNGRQTGKPNKSNSVGNLSGQTTAVTAAELDP